MFEKGVLFFNTVKYLKLSQIANRIKRKVATPGVAMDAIPTTSSVIHKFIPAIKYPQSMFNGNTFVFLNKEFSVEGLIDWNSSDQDKLWLYNLHYFNDLNAVSSENRAEWHRDIIQRWVNENPIGSGNGWEPYPSSLRIVNWIKWSLSGEKLRQNWVNSLTYQTRFLSRNLEYHLLGNHLFANAKALIFSGLYFSGHEANKWYQDGMSILNKELSEQVLDDGGHFELSPMYHAIFLEDLLDLINLHHSYGKPLPEEMINKAILMLDWLHTMSHPDGEISFFNDSTFGVSPSLASLVDYSKRLGIGSFDRSTDSVCHLKESGYIRISNSAITVLADVAKIGPNYIPGHGHADSLSFEMSFLDERVIVNSGVSTYEPGTTRSIQRGTSMHSTVVVDNENSSEVWGGFRVARRANVFNICKNAEGKSVKFSACHNGYKRLKKGVVHCREWHISQDFLEIVDNVVGSGKHRVESIFPIHPKVEVNNVEGNSVKLVTAKGKELRIEFMGKGKLTIRGSYYYPEFGLSINNKRLIYSYSGDMPLQTTIKILW